MKYLMIMDEKDIPLYVIVELLIRVSFKFNHIGSYKNHFYHEGKANVMTQRGIVTFPVELLIKQFDLPDAISDEEIYSAAMTFSPYQKV